jgi:hypothetical protein
MISIETSPNLPWQVTREGPVLLWREASRGGREGLLIVVHPCTPALDGHGWHVDLSVYALAGSATRVELNEERAWVIDRDGSLSRLERAFRARVKLPQVVLVHEPGADPDLAFWVDEALDGDLLTVVEDELERGLDRAEAAQRAPAPPARPAVGRNQPCPCGSGRKYKRCCLGAA